MAFKYVLLLAFAAVARGSVVAPVANVAIAAKLADSEFDPNPQYTFAYDVKDAITGDFKSQVESRNGGIVQGQYAVNDPDGTRRVVDYTADPVNGFNAVVSRGPQLVAAAPVVARVAAPVVAAPAPVARAIAAPYFPAARAVAAPVVAPVHPVAAPAPVVARVAAPFALPAAAPVAYPAPVAARFAAPVAYNAPLPAAPIAYSSPFGYSSAYTI